MEAKTAEIESSLPVKSIVLCVRYEPQYRIGDSLGALVDSILHAAGSPYNPKFFPLSTSSAIEQELFNPDSRDKLRINQSRHDLRARHFDKRLKGYSAIGKGFQSLRFRAYAQNCPS